MKVKPNVNSVRVFMFHPELYQDFNECCFGGPLVGSIGSIRPRHEYFIAHFGGLFLGKKKCYSFLSSFFVIIILYCKFEKNC